MPAPLLLDLSHTSHTRARTGIQRVARSLHAALGDDAIGITHDPHLGAWRTLESWEEANLTADSAASSRGARWPLPMQLRSRTRKLFGMQPAVLPENSGLLVPEIFSASVARAWPAVFARANGPRAAIFHDAIALKFPELTPAKTVARFPAYLVELLAFDGIAAVSEDSRAALVDYWRWSGAKNPPPVVTIPLGIDSHGPGANGEISPRAADAKPIVLSVGSIEGRKNHLALLEACERLWLGGEKFTLHLIGLAQPQTGAMALAKIRAMQASGRDLRYDGPVSDAAVATAYRACTFSVYPSLIEGFGLPVLESLSREKPCICSARGALGEAARGGGCLALESVDSAALTSAISRLLTDREELDTLRRAARVRSFRSWSDTARDLVAWMRELKRS